MCTKQDTNGIESRFNNSSNFKSKDFQGKRKKYLNAEVLRNPLSLKKKIE